jgi:hypothetical protein
MQGNIAWLLVPPVGILPHERCRHHGSISYRAESWSKPRQGDG